MQAWASFVGTALTAAGIILGFTLPTIGAHWADQRTSRREFWLRLRFICATVIVLIGTGLQMWSAWPS